MWRPFSSPCRQHFGVSHKWVPMLCYRTHGMAGDFWCTLLRVWLSWSFQLFLIGPCVRATATKCFGIGCIGPVILSGCRGHGFLCWCTHGLPLLSSLAAHLHTLCLAVCFLMALLVAFLPKERWDTIANVIIAGSVVVYIVPAIHWLVICEKGRDAIGPLFLSQLVCTGSAAIFFTQYIPERFAPGWFDRFGNSHQLWHIAIYMSAALFGECLVRVYGLIESGSFCN